MNEPSIAAMLGRFPLSTLCDCWEPASEAALSQLESKLGAKLPDDYREFLRLRNGGRLPPPVRVTSLERWERMQTIGAPSTFNSVGCTKELPYREIATSTRWNADYLPEGAIAIGDSGENEYCLDLTTGRIGYVDRDRDPGTPPVLVAHSFRDFLAAMELDAKELLAEVRLRRRPKTPEFFIAMYHQAALCQWFDSAKRPPDEAHALAMFEVACDVSNRDAVAELLRRFPTLDLDPLLDIVERMEFADAYLMTVARAEKSSPIRTAPSEYLRTCLAAFGRDEVDRYPPLG